MYIEPEILAEIRRIDALSYFLAREPTELKREGADRYRLKSDNSCTVSEKGWYDFGRGEGGKSAIDFLVKMRGYSLSEACEIVDGSTIAVYTPPTRADKDTGEFVLPEPNNKCYRVIKYLSGRGIDNEIISYCIENNILYEARKYNAAVFVGYDEKSVARYAFIRGTVDTSSFRREADYSQKKYGFRITKPENTTLNISESIIDGLSVATLFKMSGYKWDSQNYLPLGGVYQKGISDTRRQLDKYPSIIRYLEECSPHGFRAPPERINLWFDNDRIGREASEYLKAELTQICGDVRICVPPRVKDWNNYLTAKLQQQKITESER